MDEILGDIGSKPDAPTRPPQEVRTLRDSASDLSPVFEANAGVPDATQMQAAPLILTEISDTQTVRMSSSMAFECRFPMYVLPFEDVLRMESIQMHEDLLKEGVLVEREVGMNVLFISQCWLSRSSPDRNNIKWNMLKDLLEAMTQGSLKFIAGFTYEVRFGKHEITGKELQDFARRGHVWFDFCSVPQTNVEHMVRAVLSIPYYIGEADMFIVLQPPAQHENEKYYDVQTWASRGWCRAERLLNALSKKRKQLLVVESRHRRYIQVSSDCLIHPVGRGNFTVDADRALLGPILDVAIKQRELFALECNDLLFYRMLRVSRSILLDGTGLPSEPQLSFEEWMRAMKFHSACDGESTGWTPLRFALYDGRCDIALALLEQGADVQAPLRKIELMWGSHVRGTTILHGLAYMCDLPEGIELLLKARAEVCGDEQDMTALHYAALGGQIKTFDMLMALHPEGFRRDMFGFSPLPFCFMMGKGNMARHIRNTWSSAIHGVTDRNGNGPFHPDHRDDSDGGMCTVLLSETTYGDAVALQDAIDLGYDINAQANLSKMSWVMWGAIKVMRVLTATVEEPGAAAKFCAIVPGSTAIIMAAFNGNINATKVCLAAKADIHKKNIDGHTALHMAAQHGHEVVVEILLQHGARVGKPDRSGRTPAMLAARSGCVETVALLIRHGDSSSAPSGGCCSGDSRVLDEADLVTLLSFPST
ncbi:unnamed protein product [Polarella glacialis]|uniref:Uncharacterized protein n=1 Tax=Polarella glacialis TaxID=89957 RepID=A0A813HVW2_POLGL|nr:unnamed protein product [Polarella glacialis]CAE8674994.1 unnamed protein product [Polarella glacialis]